MAFFVLETGGTTTTGTFTTMLCDDDGDYEEKQDNEIDWNSLEESLAYSLYIRW
jgi:hypothetical protein